MLKNEKERYYLLPGMGGSARRRKVKAMLGWGIAVGFIVSALIATVLWLVHYFTRFSP
jgi:hypothetical protein